MIVKGKSRAGPASLATHLGNAEKNERVQLLETRGTVATDLRGALVEMDAYAIGTNCQKSLYHAAMSPEPPHRLTPEQRKEAVDALEANLGLTGHSRVVVLHEKLGREHLHVVWSRIDTEKMRSVSDSHNYRKHEEVARDLERRFDHAKVQGAHHERDGVERPDRTPSRAELRQEERTGIKGHEVKQEVSNAFRSSDGPDAFRAALAQRGYQLAVGDRRNFVVIDSAGGIHSLARRIDTMKAADLKTYMAPLNTKLLPDVREAQAAALAVRRREAELQDETVLEKKYGRGGDYVSQSRAALREHMLRQEKAERAGGSDGVWDRIEEGEKRRRAKNEPAASREDKSGRGNVEMSDAMRERLDRLNEAKAGYAPDGNDPGRQPEAPGRGPTRSR